MARGYGMKQLRADLKRLLLEAGVEGRGTVLLLEDHHLVEPAFLEVVNSLLSSGEVPGLFTNQELEVSVATPLREQLAEAGTPSRYPPLPAAPGRSPPRPSPALLCCRNPRCACRRSPCAGPHRRA